MPLGTYYIGSEKYIGPPLSVRVIPPKIKPEENILMASNKPPTAGSYGHASSTVNFGKHSVEFITSGKKYETSYGDFSRNGYFSQDDDKNTRDWKAAGVSVKPAMFNKIPKMPFVGYVEGMTQLRQYFPSKRDTPMKELYTTPEIFNAVDPNQLGKVLSKVANRKQDLREGLFDSANRFQDEVVSRLEYLKKNGLKVKSENPVIGIGVMEDVEGDGWTAAYYPGKRILVAESNFYQSIKDMAARYGISENDREGIEAFKRSVLLYHEIFQHGAAEIKGDPDSESLQGLIDAGHYTELHNESKSQKMRRIYRALAAEGLSYAIGSKKSGSLLERLSENVRTRKGAIDFLKYKFAKEAYELGLEGKAREDYIGDRLEETYGRLMGGEPSYKEERHSGEKGSLEEIVEGASDEGPSKKSISLSDYRSMKDAKKAYSEKERDSKSES